MTDDDKLTRVVSREARQSRDVPVGAQSLRKASSLIKGYNNTSFG